MSNTFLTHLKQALFLGSDRGKKYQFQLVNLPGIVSIYLILINNLAQAQNTPPNFPIVTIEETESAPVSPPLPPTSPPEEPKTLPVLEEILPELEITPENSAPEVEAVPNTVFVKRFEIVGSTVFTAEEIAKVLEPYSRRTVSFSELLAAQQAIDRLYWENGYITSGTFIPPQKLEDGVVIIEVVEGTVEAINIEGLKKLNTDYILDRLKIATKPPLNRDRLLNALQILQLNPLIENLAAELTAGTKPGTSILEISLQEADPFDVILSFDNYRSPSVGTNRLQVELTERNLLGFGDRFNLAYLHTEGSDALSNLSYTIPLNAYNGTFNFRFGYSNSAIIEVPFDRFNIESESTDYEFTYRQPLIQKPSQDLAVGVTFSRQDSQTTLDGNSFQLSRGAEIDGQTHISALRFFQEYTTRNAKQVFALRSQFSLGIDAFDSTTNDGDLPDSQFFSWRVQAQYLRLLTPELTLVLRSDLQLADRSLVSVEQFSLGGVYSVRGYRQDILLGDNGWFNSAEIRTTIVRIPAWETSLQIAPFLDIGKVWNTDKFGDTDNVDLDLDTNTLVSTGIGLRLQVSDRFAARLDWGIPLVDLETNGDTLQEDGVYFSLELQPL